MYRCIEPHSSSADESPLGAKCTFFAQIPEICMSGQKTALCDSDYEVNSKVINQLVQTTQASNFSLPLADHNPSGPHIGA